jgi:hypothetical protein
MPFMLFLADSPGPPPAGGGARSRSKLRFFHRHVWGEWDRAWGHGNAKSYVLERKCLKCGKVESKVIR